MCKFHFLLLFVSLGLLGCQKQEILPNNVPKCLLLSTTGGAEPNYYYKYDSKSRIIEKTTEYSFTNTITKYQYDDNDLLIREQVFNPQLTMETFYTYKNRFLVRKTENNFYSEFITDYIYDKDGKLIKQKDNSFLTIYHYDENKISSVMRYNINEIELDLPITTAFVDSAVYEYYPRRKISTYYQFQSYRITYYDDNNNLIEERIKFSPDEDERLVYLANYNDRNQILNIKKFDYMGVWECSYNYQYSNYGYTTKYVRTVSQDYITNQYEDFTRSDSVTYFYRCF